MSLIFEMSQHCHKKAAKNLGSYCFFSYFCKQIVTIINMYADNQMYGRERIVEEVEQACQAGQYAPKTLIEQLTQSVHSFVGDTEQSDDITMIALSRK